MTGNDIKEILAYISHIYPEYKVPENRPELTYQLWIEGLQGQSKKTIFEAIKTHYFTNKWPPHLSDLMANIKNARAKQLPSPEQAYLEATRLINNWDRYSSDNPMDGVSPELRETIKLLGGMDSFAKQSDDSFKRNEFKKVYEGVVERGVPDVPLLETAEDNWMEKLVDNLNEKAKTSLGIGEER